VRHCPRRRQTMLFSATLTSGVEDLAEFSMKNPARLSADQIGTTPGTLTEEVLRLRQGSRLGRVAPPPYCHQTLHEQRSCRMPPLVAARVAPLQKSVAAVYTLAPPRPLGRRPR
jgi:hypothetical protein